MRRRLEHPQHHHHRSGLRTLGALLSLAGGVFTAIGLFSFFAAFRGGGSPSMFWCAFLGLPMLGGGIALLKLGYLGPITRYVASETVPVASDALSHLAHHTKDAVQATAAAVATGLRSEAPAHRCSCGAAADAMARFCQQCGKPLADERPEVACPRCEHTNAAAAHFCAGCGHRLAAT